jgi:saccharopine dehydrogenase-like NADP-dependent oxidoreductase
VAYPNRDPTPFRQLYNIPEADTVTQGSLRYEGNPALVRALIDLGWLDSLERPCMQDNMTWAEIQQQATGADSPAEPDLIKKVD